MNETERIKWNWSHSEQKILPCIHLFFHFYFDFFNIPLFNSYGYKLHLRTVINSFAVFFYYFHFLKVCVCMCAYWIVHTKIFITGGAYEFVEISPANSLYEHKFHSVHWAAINIFHCASMSTFLKQENDLEFQFVSIYLKT